MGNNNLYYQIKQGIKDLKFQLFVLILSFIMVLPDLLKKSGQILIITYAVYSLISTALSIHSNVIEKDNQYKKNILGLKNEKKEYETKLAEVNTEEFVEKEARTRLNMRKEGEEVYLISNNEVKKSPEVTYTDTSSKSPENSTNFQKWMEILF